MVDPIHCERCDRVLDPKRVVWLELDNATNLFHKNGIPASGESQGGFPFGADCAEIEVRSTKKVARELARKDGDHAQ